MEKMVFEAIELFNKMFAFRRRPSWLLSVKWSMRLISLGVMFIGWVHINFLNLLLFVSRMLLYMIISLNVFVNMVLYTRLKNLLWK